MRSPSDRTLGGLLGLLAVLVLLSIGPMADLPGQDNQGLPAASPPDSTTTGFETLAMPNLAEFLHGLWKTQGTVRLRQDMAKAEGFVPRMNGDFEGGSGDGERAVWLCPVDGDYRIGLLIAGRSQEGGGLDLVVGGRPLGTVSRDTSAGDAFCFSSEPVTMTKGQEIEIRTVPQSSAIAFGNVCLLNIRPEIPPLKIENLCLWDIPDRPGDIPGRITIAWTTNRPALGAVSWGLHNKGPDQERTVEEGRGYVNNHRVILRRRDLPQNSCVVTVISQESEEWNSTPQTSKSSCEIPGIPSPQGAETSSSSVPRIERIRLTVAEPTGEPRSQWPVRSGVPFSRGTLKDASSCRLLAEDGREIPAQFTPLAWWGGTTDIEWLLVDFMAETESGRDVVCVLETQGGQVDQDSPIRLKARTTGLERGRVMLPLTVDTGALRLKLRRGGFRPFSDVESQGCRIQGRDGVEIVDAQGQVFSTAWEEPESVIVEADGPVRATVCVRGRFVNEHGQSHMRYLCRMHFYAGKPYVRTVFTLENDLGSPPMSVFQELRLTVPFHGEAVEVGGSEGESVSLSLGESRSQVDALKERDAGWIVSRNSDQAVAVLIPEYWQRYPKGLGADGNGIQLGLLPKLSASQYEGAGEDDLTQLYYWCDQGRYKLRTGVRVTTEFVVDCHPPEGQGYVLTPQWQFPLFAACDQDWYCASGAFGPMTPRRDGYFEAYERSLDAAFNQFLDRREKVREYGFMNYGDWFGERAWNWGNLEYDTQWALAANFARTGNLDMMWRAEDAEWHNADVDTVHAGATPDVVGKVWTHSTGHTGGYFPADWKGMGSLNMGYSDTGHTWCRGHFVVYALTGEERYLETGCKVADWLAQHTTDYKYYSERNVGWSMIGLVGAYGLTGNPFYLNGAKLMADMALWTQNPDSGGWGHWIDGNECKHDPRCWGCKSFMTGVLLHGLKAYDQAQPRGDIQDVIRANCDFLWRTAYIPKDNGFIYSQCLDFASQGGTWTISLLGDGLAYGCLLDPDQRHKALLQRATEGFIYQSGVSDFGKGFTQGACFMPWMLHDLEELGITLFPVQGSAEEFSKPSVTPGSGR